jgi:hypothetical protein
MTDETDGVRVKKKKLTAEQRVKRLEEHINKGADINRNMVLGAIAVAVFYLATRFFFGTASEILDCFTEVHWLYFVTVGLGVVFMLCFLMCCLWTVCYFLFWLGRSFCEVGK